MKRFYFPAVFLVSLVSFSACGGAYVYRPIPIDGGGAIQSVAISPAEANLVLAAVDVAGVARSIDGGITWQMSNAGLTRKTDHSVADIAFCPSRPDWVYAATGHTYSTGEDFGSGAALFRSEDAGKTWKRMSESVSFDGQISERQYGRVLVVDRDEPLHLWAGTTIHGVLESKDGGATWTPKGPKNIDFISVLIQDTKNPAVFYVGAWKAGKRETGLWKSTDSTATWKKVSDTPIRDIAISSDGAMHAVGGPDILLSKDGGETWTDGSAGLPKDRREWWNCTVAADPFHPGRFLLAANTGNNAFAHPKLFQRQSSSAAWKPLDKNVKKMYTPYGRPGKDGWHGFLNWFGAGTASLVFHPTIRGRVYLADWYTVNRSNDGGQTWKACNQGLCTTVVLNATWDRLDPTHAYLGIGDIGFSECWIHKDGSLKAHSLRDIADGPHPIVTQFEINGQIVTFAGVGEYTSYNHIYRRVGRGPWARVYAGDEGKHKPEWDHGIDISGDESTGELFATFRGTGRIVCSADGGVTWKPYQDSLLTLALQDQWKIGPVRFERDKWYVSVEGKRYEAKSPGRWRPCTEIDAVVCPADPSIRYRIERQRPMTSKPDVLLKSTDGGKTWTPIYEFPWCKGTDVTATSSKDVVWVSYNDFWETRGIAVSTNGGKDWTQLPPPPGWGVGGIFPDPNQPTRALVILNSMGIWLATPEE